MSYKISAVLDKFKKVPKNNSSQNQLRRGVSEQAYL